MQFSSKANNPWLDFCLFVLKILTELGGFEVKESKFRREMEKLRNQQSRDLTLEVNFVTYFIKMWCCSVKSLTYKY